MFNALLDDLPKLSPIDCDLLTHKVSREEVYLTVLDLPLGKRPRPDGFKAEFFFFIFSTLKLISIYFYYLVLLY